MTNKTVNIDIQVQSKSLQELENELSDINKQLKEVPVGSQAFKDLSSQAQALTKEVKDINTQVEGFTLEKKVRASQGAVTALAGGLEATVGSLGLIGVESEVFGKFEDKALSAIAASRGFIDIADGFAIMSENINLATIKSKIFGITTKQALIATGVGAFVVILGSVVAYWDEINKGVKEFGEKIPLVGKAIDVVKTGFDNLVNAFRPVLEFLNILPDEVERANTIAIESNNELITTLEREIAVLQASGASAEEVYNKKRELLNAELDNLKRNNEDKEDIYKKETEIIVLEAQEVTRKRKEELDRQKENSAKTEEDITKKYLDEQRKRLVNAGNYLINLGNQEMAATERALKLTAKTEEEKLRVFNDIHTTQSKRAIAAQEDLQKEAESYYDNLIKQAKGNTEEIIALNKLKDLAVAAIGVRFDKEEIIREVELQQALDSIREEYTQKDIDREQSRLDKISSSVQGVVDIYRDIFGTIETLSQQRYDRELLNLERQRNEIQSNNNLSVEEREQALEKIEQKERQAEIRRIKQERDQATLRQGILLAELIFKKQMEVQEIMSIANIASARASAAVSDVTTTGATQVAKASMSIGSFVATLGPLGLAAYAASIGGIIATIVSARRKAKAQIAALNSISTGGTPSTPTPTTPSIPQNTQSQVPQTLTTTPMMKTYVLSGDVSNAQEAEAKLNTKRKLT